MSRYRTCAWPGCTATAVQMHHTHHRAPAATTTSKRIVPECLQHHLLVHTEGIWITIDTNGTVHHWRPDGSEILANPTADHPGTVNALDAPQRLTDRRLALGADPDETRNQPRWHGDPFHLGDCNPRSRSRFPVAGDRKARQERKGRGCPRTAGPGDVPRNGRPGPGAKRPGHEGRVARVPPGRRRATPRCRSTRRACRGRSRCRGRSGRPRGRSGPPWPPCARRPPWCAGRSSRRAGSRSRR